MEQMQTTGLKGFPLSLQQRRLWGFQRESTGALDRPASYYALGVVALQGPLKRGILLQALQQLVEQHTILRTTFYFVPGMEIPMQVVAGHEEVALPVINLEGLPGVQRIDICGAALLREALDLEAAPFHAALFHLAEEEHVLAFCLPALCADGATLTQIVAALSRLYRACLTGEELDDEPLQYSDVSAWQDELLQEEDDEDIAHQRQQWKKLDPALFTPRHLFMRGNDVPAESWQAFRPARLAVPVSDALVAQLRQQAELQGVPLDAWLLACWQAALWRLTHEDHSLIGVVCNGRNYEELEQLPGLYSRIVPVEVSLTGDTPFQQLLSSMQMALREATRWQLYFTWDTLDTSNTTVHAYCPVHFEYERWPATFAAGSLTFSIQQNTGYMEPFALKLSACQIDEQLRLELHYDSTQITNEQASNLMQSVQMLLESAIEQPHMHVDRLDILPVAEQEKLLQTFSGPVRVRPPIVFHQLVEAQAARVPNQLAVISAGEQLTFRELNRQANQLAYLLRRRGVGPDVLVGLSLARSAQMIVGLLAVLKAGGAYMPLDSGLPAARLLYQLDEANVSLLLTQRALLEQLPEWGGQTLCMETLLEEAAQAPGENLAVYSQAANLAYVIYTSGSTGRPKGVMIRQESVVNYTFSLCELLNCEVGLQFATVSTLAADLGNTVIFCSLASGGCLQVLDYETVTSGEAFAQWVRHHPIDVLKIVPSHLSALLSGRASLPRRALLTGGEALSFRLVQRLRELGGTCQIINHYGPTEATIGVLVNPLDPQQLADTGEAQGSVPLGHPLPNTQVYVLDRWLQIVPPGSAGELYIAGDGLAMGYLQQPAQTAAAFVPHPFATTPGARLYKTGDLARYGTGGQIEFLGRVDSQVKIRGFRIELGEIESVLRSHPQIRDCTVMLDEETPGEPFIVAYAVAQQPSELSSTGLREHLQAYLPEYMLPSAFLFLKALPLTANGKIDRQQLPRFDRGKSGSYTPITGPRTATEEILLEIWKDLLALSSIRLNDNFFELGGHSLLATQLLSRLRAFLNVELPIRDIFADPTVAGLAQRVEQALQGEQGGHRPPLLPVARSQDLPLSFAQQRLWFLDQLEPGSTAYLIPHALRIQGEVNRVALIRSINEVVRRHEILRTTFQERNGEPVQLIHHTIPDTVHAIDLRGLPQQMREEVLRRLYTQETQKPCDLEQGPLFRATLLYLESTHYVLLSTIHHMLSDGWSNGVFIGELATLYEAFSSGKPSPLIPLAIQYADFAVWQRAWLRDEALRTQLAYWTQQLADLSPLELPADFPRPPVQSARGALLTTTLSAELRQQLRELSRREGATVFMTLLAAFQVLLARYSGQSDIAVGTPIANRSHSELEALIGLFTNTLVLRTTFAGNPTFVDILQSVRRMALEAYAHQEIPFEQLVEALQPQRDLSRSPLFQVLFSLQTAAQERTELTHLTFDVLDYEHTTTKFDLSLAIIESEAGLDCGLEYNTDLFKESTMARMLQHWQTLLQAIVSAPQTPVRQLPILPLPERQRVLATFNSTGAPFPQQSSVPALFAAQVQIRPDALALVGAEGSLSYTALDAAVSRLAAHLRQRGITPGSRVAICLPRSNDLLIALLAVLAAGGTYIPLDPTYPSERLAYMLSDSQASLLLSHSSVLPHLPRQSAVPVVLLPEALRQDGAVESERLAVASEYWAYLIYTSGSTGRPKGMVITQRNVVNFVWSLAHEPGLTARDRVLALTSVSFDIAVLELLAPLMLGACVVLADEQVAADGMALKQLVEQEDPTLLQATPSRWHLLLGAGWQQGQGRRLLCGGEALPPELGQQLAQTGAEVWNMYGPTETTIWSSQWRVSKGAREVRIGCGLANTQLYVLDERLEPTPLGVEGELYIGGEGVGLGYWGQAGLTAQRFVPDPFTQQPGARLYRTGDRACWREAGEVEYRGRQDQQIKLRGYRIELGEIESVLNQHPAIEASVALVQDNGYGDQRLIAYIVQRRGATPLTLDNVRTNLQQHLPEYMLPGQIVLLESLPLTPNGKINRRALLAMDAGTGALHQPASLPRTPIEELLVEIWSAVLGSSTIGIHDNFFASGGHSLLATRLISRVRSVFQVELPLRSLFQAATIAEFSPLVEQALLNGDEQHIPPLLPVARTRPLPLSFTQQRLWFLDQLEPGSTAYLMFGHCWLQGRLDVVRLERSLATVIQRHESLRTVFLAVDGQPEQVIKSHITLPVAVIDLSALPGQTQERETQRLVQQNSQLPFDLARGPLLRVSVLRLEEQRHALLQTMHHIISDGWSMENFTRELTILYDAFAEGKPSPLLPLPIQYPDFAVWQRAWLRGEVVEQKLDYWKRQLAGLEPLHLPTDHPRPAMQSTRGSHQAFQLSVESTKQLKALCQREGVTLFMLVLAAFQVLLARYTGQEDIAVGTSIANRDRGELEALIGFFVNTLVMRTDLSGNPTFLDLLQRVRDVALGAYAHQDLPIESIIEALQPERDTSRSPLFQVLLLMQNTPTENQELAGLMVQPLSMENHTAKFDLTLSVREASQGLRGVLEYNTDLFDGSTIARMLEHWQVLLESIATQPERPIADLPLLTDAELHQVLSAWGSNVVDAVPGVDSRQNAHAFTPERMNGAKARHPQSVHEHFELQARRAPDAVAVVYAEKHLTYQTLNQRANQVARYLSSLGVGPEVLVGIFLERSVEVIIAVLGVLKAGAAYLPLEPTTPTERLAVILAECRPLLLLTRSHLHSYLPEGLTRTVQLDRVWPMLVGQRSHDLRLPGNAHALAYVIATSGSTGTPKGVLIEQQSLLNVTLNACAAYQLTPADRVLQFASLSFDTAAEEIYPCLLAGATLVIRSETMLDSLQAFVSCCEEAGLTVLDLPTAYWHLLATELSADTLSLPQSLRLTIIGGEKAQREQWERWYSSAPARIRLVNTYGPTETTIVATRCDLDADAAAGRAELPIGRALQHAQTYILDRYLHPVPIGVPGQLYLGGVGLARGYMQRLDLTARSFIPHPWSQQAGLRLYTTGDRVRWREDGQIEYLGRTDRQVKLRGYRIELGEIEAVLRQHPQVQDCLALLHEDQGSQSYLLAYLVIAAPTSSMKEELYRYARSKLPQYMLPADFIFLEQFPLTASGKVDQRALARQNWLPLASELETQPVLPRTPVEEILVGIWQELLGSQAIGLHENFFLLGGHSLLAVQVIARIRNYLRIDLPLRVLFEAPTVAELSRHVEQARLEGRGLEVPPLQPVARGQALPLSFAQQRLWFLDQLEATSTAYTIPYAVIVKGQLEIAALDASLQAVIRRHESLRTTYHSHDGRPEQVIADHLTLPLPVVDLQQCTESMCMELGRRILREETRKPFDLQQGPLLRACLLRLQPQEHLVIIMMHHIVSDAWSVGVFIREVTAHYTACTQHKPAPLPPLPIQYADFALWQQQYLQKKTLQAHLDYWQKQLAGAKALELPADHPRLAAQNYRGASYPFALPAQLSGALTTLSQQEGTTTFMTLLAAFQTLLYRVSGQSDIVLGTDVAGRNHVETEPLIGFFVNLLVLRNDLSGMPTFRMVLRRVREMVLDAYTYQDVPFEMLVEHLRLERHENRTPLVNLLFVMQNVPLNGEGIADLTFKPFQSEVTTAKFDLALFIHEGPDGLRGAVNYSTDLFERQTIATLISRFQHILQQSVLDPDIVINLLDIYAEEEKKQIGMKKQNERAARSNKMRRSKGKEINLS